MQYSQRDLRAADMLALLFVGLGIALVAIGVIRLVTEDSTSAKSKSTVAAAESAPRSVAVVDKKAPARSVVAGVFPLVIGIVCLCLGTALNLKVRQLKRTGGKEPADYEGVPMS